MIGVTMTSQTNKEEPDAIIDDLQSFLKPSSKKTLEQQYRDSVTSWVRCLSSNENKLYGERLFKAVERMNKLKDKLCK